MATTECMTVYWPTVSSVNAMVVLNPVPLPLEHVLTALVTGRAITVKCVSLCTIPILMGQTASHVMLDTGVTCVTNVLMDTTYVQFCDHYTVIIIENSFLSE